LKGRKYMFDETAGTQEALDGGIDQGPFENVVEEGFTGLLEGEVGGLFPSTPPPERPLPEPQAHRGRITSVTVQEFENGGKGLKFNWKSLENAQDDSLMPFLPQEYIDNPQVDATILSEVAPTINKADGTTFEGDSPRVKYAKSVRNSKGTGVIETIVKYAVAQGHSCVRQQPRTFEQLAAYLNELCTGTDIVALMRAKGGDGDFSDKLRTTAFGSIENVGNTKFFKNYRRLWE
jgi:hypothetical protein